jgi:hypothetical protein
MKIILRPGKVQESRFPSVFKGCKEHKIKGGYEYRYRADQGNNIKPEQGMFLFCGF